MSYSTTFLTYGTSHNRSHLGDNGHSARLWTDPSGILLPPMFFKSPKRQLSQDDECHLLLTSELANHAVCHDYINVFLFLIAALI